MSTTNPEIYWLTLTILATAFMWAPYILTLIIEHGVGPAFTDGDGVLEAQSAWAQRAKKAHYNAVENLVVFAPLVLALVFLEKTDSITALAAMVYFYARIAHYLVYLAGIPVVRTVIFLAGFGCQLTIGLRLLGVL